MKQFLRLLKFARPYYFRLGFGFILILLLGQAGLFMPLMQKFIIDNILFRSRDALASIDLMFLDDLNGEEKITGELCQLLGRGGILLSQDTTVSIEVVGRRWKLVDEETGERYIIARNVFQIESDSARDVDLVDGVPPGWREQLKKDYGVLLSSAATISTFSSSTGDNGWEIIDNDKRHLVWLDGDKLNVHEGELKIYPGTLSFSFLGRQYTRTPVGWLVVVLIVTTAFFATLAILRYVQTYVMTWVSQRILFDLRNHVFSHLQSLSMRFYDVKGTGQILSRVRDDVASLRTLVTSTSIDIITDAVTLVIMLVLMFGWHWKLTLFSLIVMPLIVGNYFYFINRLRPLWHQWRDKWADIATGLYEAVAGAKVVKAFGRERQHERKLFRDMRQTFEWEIKVTRHQTAMQRIAQFLRMLGKGIVLSYGGYLVVEGEFTVGGMIAFYAFLERLQAPMMNLININASIQEAMVSTQRVFGLLDSEPTVEESADAIELPEIHGHVKFENVQFSYEPENPVLRDINLEAQRGMMVALVGPSGCGKTTVANLLGRFYDPTGGTILFDGHDLREVTTKSLRSQMGIVLQDNFLFEGSVAENIRFGRPNASDEEIVEAALAANAHQFIVEQLPEGYETGVGERGMRLSGGQKQRLSIARTILRDPRILILDEATSALDTESEEQIQQALDRLMKSRTSFVIAHRLSTVLKADMIVVMKEGRIVESGTHEKLVEMGGMYATMYRKQFKSKKESNDAWLE